MCSPSTEEVVRDSRSDDVTAARARAQPALPQDLEFSGEMPGMGFTDRQWLVRRGDRVFQLTDLCYRVLREINGQRTIEEIAARVSDKAERVVTAEHLKRILETKL